MAYYLKPDEQIVRLLLGQESLDPRLVSFCQVTEPTFKVNDMPVGAEMRQALSRLVIQARDARQPLRFYFCGPRGVGKRHMVEVLAGQVGAPLLLVDLLRALAAGADFDLVLKFLFREAWFRDAILYIDGLDALRGDGRVLQYQRLTMTLSGDMGITILAGEQPWIPSQVPAGYAPAGVIVVSFPLARLYPFQGMGWHSGRRIGKVLESLLHRCARCPMPTLPVAIATVIVAFAPLFSRRVFEHAKLLVVGEILAPGKRTFHPI
jgi:hypothetical protein